MRENPYLLERYKYVLDQKKELNKTTFLIGAFYQAVLAVIFAAQFQVVRSVSDHSLSSDIAKLGTWGLFWCAAAVSAICVMTLVAGLFAWLNYRSDEAEIEAVVFGKARKPIGVMDAFRWYESYIIIGILLVVLSYAIVIYKIIIPLF
ncbi:hypothetical protein FJW04_09705 [Mesorhizobium sp. B2-7-3]|uniref:hypothetical protein n=1 Tax=unclassified Mesorhizobium TaxID=325217 RepID=UPI00112A3F03|nr:MULTISPECIES: hypothetical protein [unclassified Mesorhizobium]TPJ17806.1 hypothetical protein FJW04_09705 [Mesorhizobium sp. B2-7-3]TPK77956.1 hypothetical protein FJ527_12890 [Mesorhizobium sp. B2-4-18]